MQDTHPIPANKCLLTERNICFPRLQDVSEDVILHDADEQNVVQMSWIELGQVVDLALCCGWDPIGTSPPSRPPVGTLDLLDLASSPEDRWEAWAQKQREIWSWTCLSQDFPEVVQDDDACAMANALESALPDLEEEEFAQTVKKFITFCESSGGFTIGRFERELR